MGKEKKNSEKEKFIVVKKVEKGSIADEIGLESGDKIVSINGEKVVDIFDYRFLITDEVIELKIIKCNSDLWEIEIEKDVYEDLGLEFDSPMIDSQKLHEQVYFLFYRSTAEEKQFYFKDDDTRLSFLRKLCNFN